MNTELADRKKQSNTFLNHLIGSDMAGEKTHGSLHLILNHRNFQADGVTSQQGFDVLMPSERRQSKQPPVGDSRQRSAADGNKQYDCICSTGLFDDFNDDIFVLAIKKFKQWLKPGGEMVIGNVVGGQSGREPVGVGGNWCLNWRSEQNLTGLALAAGFDCGNIIIEREASGKHLCLRLRNDA